jgi:hypothetical protein
MSTQPAYSACAARVTPTRDGSSQTCIAILADPGVDDVLAFILPDGSTVKTVWTYHLAPWAGCFTIHPDNTWRA